MKHIEIKGPADDIIKLMQHIQATTQPSGSVANYSERRTERYEYAPLPLPPSRPTYALPPARTAQWEVPSPIPTAVYEEAVMATPAPMPPTRAMPTPAVGRTYIPADAPPIPVDREATKLESALALNETLAAQAKKTKKKRLDVDILLTGVSIFLVLGSLGYFFSQPAVLSRLGLRFDPNPNSPAQKSDSKSNKGKAQNPNPILNFIDQGRK